MKDQIKAWGLALTELHKGKLVVLAGQDYQNWATERYWTSALHEAFLFESEDEVCNGRGCTLTKQ